MFFSVNTLEILLLYICYIIFLLFFFLKRELINPEGLKKMPRFITPEWLIDICNVTVRFVGILTKYGFGDVFGQIRIWEYINIEKRSFTAKVNLRACLRPSG